MKYIRTKEGVYEVKVNKYHELVYCKNNQIVLSCNIIKQSETLEELCDEFVFDSDVSSYVIDKKYIKHTKAIILKIYKENDETDYVKAMHPKFYGAIWTDKGLIYVAKMNENGDLELK